MSGARERVEIPALSRRRYRLPVLVLVPLVIVAVGVLAYFTFRTTLQIDSLRQRSVLEATLALATEKAARVDRQIIDQDNVVMAIADPARLDELAERWLPTAQRETPSVRAILVLDESRTVLAFASRASSDFTEEEGFRRLLVDRMASDMDRAAQAPDELHHLHREHGDQSYLLSFWKRIYDGRRYLVVARHDIGRIVRETLPILLDRREAPRDGQGSASNIASRVNVVDSEGRLIYGPALGAGEFTVTVPFPTTLYDWRVQVSPLASKELATRVQNRRLLELTMVSLSCVIIVVAALAILLVAEKERRVSRLKSEFVANVSHELKTPLALVRMFAEMLQSGRVKTEEKRKEYLDVIVRESERLSALIENVLDFARLERGGGSYEFREGDVGEAVTHAADVYRYRAEREGTRLVLDIEPNLPPTRIDERAIQLAVVNLVDNALKYAPDGEEIVVRARAEGSNVRIDVLDEGPGIAPEDRQRIFERFIRLPTSRKDEATSDPARSSTTSPPRGSGIGLALVKHIAESHGGRAWVESRRTDRKAEGRPDFAAPTSGSDAIADGQGDAREGSIFSFTVPVRAPSQTLGAP